MLLYIGTLLLNIDLSLFVVMSPFVCLNNNSFNKDLLTITALVGLIHCYNTDKDRLLKTATLQIIQWSFDRKQHLFLLCRRVYSYSKVFVINLFFAVVLWKIKCKSRGKMFFSGACFLNTTRTLNTSRTMINHTSCEIYYYTHIGWSTHFVILYPWELRAFL